MKNVEKRDAILQAAMELIAEHGFHEAPMSMIADKAGVGTGTIYSYFENKDVLIQHLFSELRERIMAHLHEGYSAERSLHERYIHLKTKLIKYCIENPMHFRFMEQYMNSPYGVTVRREKLFRESIDESDIFQTLFDQGVAQKILKDFPLPVYFALSFGPMLSLTRDHVLGFITLDEKMIDDFVEACWEGIKAPDKH